MEHAVESEDAVCYVPVDSSYDDSESTAGAHPKSTKRKKTAEYCGSVPQGTRKYVRPKRPCPFCEQFKSCLKRHIKLAHRDNKKVQAILRLPTNAQNHQFDLLKKEGIDTENKKILISNNQGNENKALITERKSRKSKLRRCNVCMGFYVAAYFSLHFKKCRKKNDYSGTSGSSVNISSHSGFILNTDDISQIQYTPDFIRKILERYRDDDVGNLCRTDLLLKYIAFYYYYAKSEDEKDPRKQKGQDHKKDIMGKARLLGRLLINFRNIIGRGDICLQKMLDREYLPQFKDAVARTINVNSVSRHHLGFLINDVVKILLSRLSCLKREGEGAEMSQFLKALNNPINWVPLFGKQQNYKHIRSNFDLRVPTNLPKESELKKLILHLEDRILHFSTNFTPNDYFQLRRVVLTRLTFLNARRGGEPCRLLISQWNDSKNDKWLNKDFLRSALESDISDKDLLSHFKIAFQKGKGIKTVSLMIPSQLIPMMDILVNFNVRQKVGIHEQNPFVFATRGNNDFHSQGVVDITYVMQDIGVTIKAKDMRHYLSTKTASIKLSPETRSLFYLHMGHEKAVNQSTYQSELVVERITKVGKIIKTVDDFLKCTAPLPIAGWGHVEGNSSPLYVDSPSEIVNSVDSLEREISEEDFPSTSDLAANSPSGRHLMPQLLQSNPGTSKEAVSLTNQTTADSPSGQPLRSSEQLSHFTPKANQDHSEQATRLRTPQLHRLKVSDRNLWSPESVKAVQNFPAFQKYLNDLSPLGAKGSIPRHFEIRQFIKENPSVLNYKNSQQKKSLILSKVFGLRQTFRRRYRKVKRQIF